MANVRKKLVSIFDIILLVCKRRNTVYSLAKEMKVFLGLLWLVTFHCWLGNGVQPLEISRDLLDAIKEVESGGSVYAIGDVNFKNPAYGPYQIRWPYYADAVRFNPSLTDGGKTFSNVWGQGSEEYSERVLRSYMGGYATRRRLGRQPTDEDIARIHNGGPNGYKNPKTLSFWKKVKEAMDF